MPMNMTELMNAVIDDGIHEIRVNYLKPHQRDKREGGIAGLEACRGKQPLALIDLVAEAKIRSNNARHSDAPDYWYHRYFELQIEWVINVVSAAMYTHNLEPLVIPTQRGYLKAIDILGVKTH